MASHQFIRRRHKGSAPKRSFFSPAAQRKKTTQPETEDVQAKTADKSADTSSDFETALQALNGKGDRMPANTQAFMESRMDHDFSNVRIHQGAEASQLSSHVHAKAFTHGNDIYFNKGEYDPGSDSGRHLLSHELTHVVQQGKGNVKRHIQRAEYATYISTQGDQAYLDGARGFFKNWGYPNIKDASNMNDVVTDLAKSTKNIDKFRIVSHANPGSLEFGLMNEISPKGFRQDEAKFTEPKPFNEFVAANKLMNDATYTKWTRLLLGDPDVKALLTDMTITSVPAIESEKGIFLRALLESIFIAISLESGTDKKPKFANSALLNSFITSRISAYKPVLTQGMDAKALAAFNKAQAAFPTKASDFLIASNQEVTFTSYEANYFGTDLKDPAGTGLKPEIIAAIREGSGSGPYLKNLQKARSKISTSTVVEIRGCNAGDTPAFLDSFRSYFGAAGNQPIVTAPDLFEYFFANPFDTFTQHPANVKSLQDLWTNTNFGKNYNLSHRIRNKDLIVVVDARDNKVDQVISRYGLSLSEAEIKSLNPQIKDFSALTSGTQLWLKARRIAVDASTTTVDDFCKKHFGSTSMSQEIIKINSIKDPTKLTVGQQFEIVPAALSSKTGYAGAELGQADFEKNIRGGEAYMFMKTGTQPSVIMDDAKRASALAKWLAAQNYGLTPETAADFEKKLSGATGVNYMRQRFINFLSKSYPSIEDPILPDDPRYKGHIKKRP